MSLGAIPRRSDGEEIASHDGAVRVLVPVLELVGSSEIRGSVIFEVRDGKIAAFELTSERLRR